MVSELEGKAERDREKPQTKEYSSRALKHDTLFILSRTQVTLNNMGLNCAGPLIHGFLN